VDSYPETLWKIIEAVEEHDELLSQLEEVEQEYQEMRADLSSDPMDGAFLWICLCRRVTRR